MSELSVTLLRLGYLALLWIFVLTAIGVLRRDLYGNRIASRRNRRRDGVPATPARGTPATTPPAKQGSGPRRLVVTQGPLRGTTLPLASSSILIGRAPSCTLVLDDDYSSSRHARIFPHEGQWFVEDLGSTNGTFLGDARVEAPTAVAAGVPVRIGQSVFELQR